MRIVELQLSEQEGLILLSDSYVQNGGSLSLSKLLAILWSFLMPIVIRTGLG